MRRLSTLGAAICPPILNYTRQDNVGLWCNDINNSNLAIIKDVKPDIVILYAYWPYGINSMGNIEGIYELNKLGETIFQLKTIGIKNVIIIGPTPYWKNSLPDNIMLYWKTKNSMKDTPVYMSYGLDENIHLYNNTMRNIATTLGVKYIDSISYLCTADGCLTRDSVDGTNIASIDYGHLTIAAAENFINRISNEIFTNTK